jgi:hypothetical protein
MKQEKLSLFTVLNTLIVNLVLCLIFGFADDRTRTTFGALMQVGNFAATSLPWYWVVTWN